MTRFAEYPWRAAELLEYIKPAHRDLRQRRVERRVIQAVQRCWSDIPFYRRLWTASGVEPLSVRRLQDLSRLPTFDISDARRSVEQWPPYGDYWNPRLFSQLAFVKTSGGTTGRQRFAPLTWDDRRRSVEVAARRWVWGGVGPGDIAHISYTFSTHGAAWTAAWSLDKVRAAIVTASSGRTTPTEMQLELIEDLGATVLVAMPSYAGVLAATAASMGKDPSTFGVRKIFISGEVATPATRAALEKRWNSKLYDMYGTMETNVWCSFECEPSREAGGALGMHIWDDAIHVEVLQPDGSPCRNGEFGELTLTSWISEIGPKMRYRMGDIVALDKEPCVCGLDLPRMLPVQGRTSDSLRFHGKTIWASTIESVIRDAALEIGEYAVLCERRGYVDVLTVLVELSDVEAGARVSAALRDAVRARLGLSVNVEPVATGMTKSLTGLGGIGKIRRLHDRRDRDAQTTDSSGPDDELGGVGLKASTSVDRAWTAERATEGRAFSETCE